MIVLLSTVAHALVTADAGDDFMAYPGQVIELNGSGAGDGDLDYSWRRVGGPPAELDDPALPNPRFTANEAGTYRWELIVNAGSEASLPDEVAVVIVHTDAGTLHDRGCAVAPIGGAWFLGLLALGRRFRGS